MSTAMKSIIRNFLCIVIGGVCSVNFATAKQCASSLYEEELKSSITSEDNVEPNSFSIFDGTEFKALLVAWNDLTSRKIVTEKELAEYRFSIWCFDEHYVVVVSPKVSKNPGGLDGGGYFDYKISYEGYKIISVSES